jgi:hypothetical protein
LSDISVTTLACFGGPLAWQIFLQSFTVSQCLFLSIRWVSYKQQIVRYSFLILFANQCVLMGPEFKPQKKEKGRCDVRKGETHSGESCGEV